MMFVISADDYIKSGRWCVSELAVMVLKSYEDASVHEEVGTIREVTSDACEIYFENLELDDNGADRTIPFEFVVPVEPNVGERVGDH